MIVRIFSRRLKKTAARGLRADGGKQRKTLETPAQKKQEGKKIRNEDASVLTFFSKPVQIFHYLSVKNQTTFRNQPTRLQPTTNKAHEMK